MTEMNEIIAIALALGGGIVIGIFFFGGLWWTIKKGIISKKPALWFFISLLIRLSVALVGFYLIGNKHWERMLVCLAGFLVGRYLINRVTRILGVRQNQ